MNVAICGYPPIARQIQDLFKTEDLKIKFFIVDFVINRGEDKKFTINLPQINFFEFRRLINAGELDGVIIAEDGRQNFTRNVVQTCKFYDIPKIGVPDLVFQNPFAPIHWFSPEKSHLMQLEVNIIDNCNLNCKGCTHFAGLFDRNEVYPLENFRKDVRQIAQSCELSSFFLLGGEPFILKNIDEYIKISRRYFPNTDLRIVTNGLLIPSLPQKILNTIKEANVFVEISEYPPTRKIIDKIKSVLENNKIFFNVRSFREKFSVFMTLNAENDPLKSIAACANSECRILRDGKIYKCPIDALSYKFTQYFGIENYPKATGVDIYAPNFPLMLQMLDGTVEMCHWCAEKNRSITWEPSNNPKIEDWLADPKEVKHFL